MIYPLVLVGLVALVVGFYLGAAFVGLELRRARRPVDMLGRTRHPHHNFNWVNRCADCGELLCNADCPGIGRVRTQPPADDGPCPVCGEIFTDGCSGCEVPF